MVHELTPMSDPKTGKACPWKDQMSLDLKFVDGKHKGTQVLYKVSSVGGLNACRAILDAILERLDMDTEFVCPVVSLDSDSYKHKSYGKTYVPKIEIVGWANMDGVEEDGDEEAPVKTLAAPEPEPEPEPESVAEDDAPRRRRRV
jgi:hypothetical protein